MVAVDDVKVVEAEEESRDRFTLCVRIAMTYVHVPEDQKTQLFMSTCFQNGYCGWTESSS
jgi:hypothetical protein